VASAIASPSAGGTPGSLGAGTPQPPPPADSAAAADGAAIAAGVCVVALAVGLAAVVVWQRKRHTVASRDVAPVGAPATITIAPVRAPATITTNPLRFGGASL
jgi:hypothetical protein